MPRAWTDADGGAAEKEHQADSRYSIEGLREYILLVEALQARQPSVVPNKSRDK